MNAEHGYKLVFSSVSSFLLECGYLKRAKVFWKDNSETRNLIEFQRGQKTTSEGVVFTVNLSIVLKALLDPEIDDLNSMRGHEGHLFWRIGDFMSPREDKWWKVEASTDAFALAQEICQLLAKEALPRLQQCSTVSEVTALLRSDQHPPMSERVRKQLLDELTRL